MPYQRPGWPLPNGHIVRSNMEAALCDYLSKAKEPHAHRTLSFDVPIGNNRFSLYVPSIVLTESKKDGRIVVIEPVDSARPGGGVRRLHGFRQQHSDQYFVVVVGRRALRSHLPENAYHAFFPLEDFQPLDEFLRQISGQ
jgi:hypothetical protein